MSFSKSNKPTSPDQYWAKESEEGKPFVATVESASLISWLANYVTEIERLRLEWCALSESERAEAVIMKWPALQGFKVKRIVADLAKLPRDDASIQADIRAALSATKGETNGNV